MVIGNGFDRRYLSLEQIDKIIKHGLDSLNLDKRKVLIIIPDGTRTMPMPDVFRIIKNNLTARVDKLDFLVALGTHPPMNDEQLSELIGEPVLNGAADEIHIYNHEWHKSEVCTPIGKIPADEISQITSGLLVQDVVVTINRLVFDYDQIIICGPVFPHEVAGFSGGNKYLFPGIAGAEIIHLTHWLGALITSHKVIGTPDTFVRAVIDRASDFIPKPVACFAFVVDHGGTSGLFFGKPKEAWGNAVALSEKKHIVYMDRPFRKVLSIMPEMYNDLWTAAKGMYKVEPVVEDGGEVIIYAPHMHEISYTHGYLLDEIGYHCRDYFLSQWDQFKKYPGGVLAHSTHLKGMGEYDPATKIEKDRINVTLATGIPEERCRKVNLGYLAPEKIRLEDWIGREKEGILVVPQAGEMLFRLKQPVNASNL